MAGPGRPPKKPNSKPKGIVKLGTIAAERELGLLRQIDTFYKENADCVSECITDTDLGYQYVALKDLQKYGLIESCFTNYKRYAYTITERGKAYLREAS